MNKKRVIAWTLVICMCALVLAELILQIAGLF